MDDFVPRGLFVLTNKHTSLVSMQKPPFIIIIIII